MKVGIVTVAYNEEELIGACTKQFQHFDLPHLVMVSTTPWHGKTYKTDRTKEIAQDNGAMVFNRTWGSEADQRNYGLTVLEATGYDWALIVDADELYKVADIDKILTHIERSKDYNAIRIEDMFVYWKTRNWVIENKQEDKPIIAVRTNVRFLDKRAIDNEHSSLLSGVPMHHLSYVRNNAAMWKKIETFEHHQDFDIKHWYNDVWLKWKPNNEDLHPVNPPQFKRAVVSNNLDELELLFNEAT